MKVIGVDLGSRTMGIAISDKFQILASPIETYRFREDDYEDALKYLINLCSDNSTNKVVLGLPKNMNNTIGERAEISIEFKKRLVEHKIEVILWDERLSTREVNQVMIKADVSRKKRKMNVDKLAATVILQGYLDSNKG